MFTFHGHFMFRSLSVASQIQKDTLETHPFLLIPNNNTCFNTKFLGVTLKSKGAEIIFPKQPCLEEEKINPPKNIRLEKYLL